MLTRTPDRTLADQLAERFAERIRARLLSAGARLPSVRECARQQGVSPHTVVAAYDKLQAQGLVLARLQRGFFVRDVGQKVVQAHVDQGPAAMVSGVRELPPATLQESLGVRAAGSRINAMALIRGMFHQLSDRPQPGAGTLPRAWLEEARFLPAAVRKVAAGGALRQASLSYGEPMGDARLRAALAQRLGACRSPPRRARSSPPWAPPRRWTSSAARCSRPATRCWWRSPAGASSSPAWTP